MAQAAPFVMTASRSEDALHSSEVISNLYLHPTQAAPACLYAFALTTITRDLELASYGENGGAEHLPYL